MKYAVLAGAMALTLYAGVCEAQDLKTKEAPDQASTAQAQAPRSDKLKHVDLGENVEQNVSRVGVMPPGESYDEDTGIPDVTGSDQGMNLD